MNYYRTLANSPQERVCALAETVLAHYSHAQVKLLSGPRPGLVMLKVKETVANSQFYAGEALVTEVRLELDGQFGFGMVLGNSPRHALAIALVDAAMRKQGALIERLSDGIGVLDRELTEKQHRLQALAATTKVNFERM